MYSSLCIDRRVTLCTESTNLDHHCATLYNCCYHIEFWDIIVCNIYTVFISFDTDHHFDKDGCVQEGCVHKISTCLKTTLI